MTRPKPSLADSVGAMRTGAKNAQVGRLPTAPLLSPCGPSLASRLGANALRSTIASGTVIRPVFTHRVHREPIARGHRQFILAKQEWR